MTDYTIKAGDTLIALATKFGLMDWSTILDHPQNATHKSSRPDPGVLAPGETIYIPNPVMRHEPSQTDSKHSFRVGQPKAWLRIALKDAAGKPLAGSYTLAAETTTSTGALPSDGVLEALVPVSVKEATLTVVTADGTTESWTLQIGFMQPLDTAAGLAARLHNLGFGPPDPFEATGDELAAAVKAFQARVGATVNGTVDDALRQKVRDYYDPAIDETSLDAAMSPRNDAGVASS